MKKIGIVLLATFLSLIGRETHATVWPLSGTQTPDTITSDYGPRNVSNGSTFHYGIDLRANTMLVKSITATAISNIWLDGAPTGNYVQTANGFRYLHLSERTSSYEKKEKGDRFIYEWFVDIRDSFSKMLMCD